ncbi:NAD(P)/FAD-dependent oxidoreductase [Thermovenabulum sp.]|uniref:NAD(P)/FAD-dependent oxidoreductase n=1 Tax=Thermovenabulum sp. TaxID=3100335 RepID=UPI003C7B9A0B
MAITAEAVVIGGGIHGVSVLYNLAKKGMKNIFLFEKEYLTSGATGRCAAGVRHQFGTKINCLLMKESMKLLENLEEELNFDRSIEFTRGGYLMLAYNESQVKQFNENIRLQHELGIKESVFLSPEEIKEIVPDLNLEGVIGASYNPKDGHANPFMVTFAYAQAARRMGANIITYNRVLDIEIIKPGLFKVITEKGVYETPVVVNCAGAWGKELANKLGIDIPVYPERHQIFVTEPIEYFLPCMVISFLHGTYFKQSPNGTILMGVGDPEHEVKDFNVNSSWGFLENAVKKFVFHLPKIKNLRIVRHWAGLYDMTPDQQAIIGKTDVEGFYLDLGWSGHGFQMGPIVGLLLAELIVEGKSPIDIDVLNLKRFEKGELIFEPACV